MAGFDYHLAKADGDMVAGLMEHAGRCRRDAAVLDDLFRGRRRRQGRGGDQGRRRSIHRAPADIPGTGRFAVVGDPQGAGFGILQPEPMPGQEGAGGAFNQKKTGHGNWNELMSSDPEAGFGFYSGLFGWKKSQAVEMGAMGTYQVFSHDGTDIGGMMGLGNSPVPAWLPYFGANGVDAAIERITRPPAARWRTGRPRFPAAPSSPSPRTRRAPGSPSSGRRSVRANRPSRRRRQRGGDRRRRAGVVGRPISRRELRAPRRRARPAAAAVSKPAIGRAPPVRQAERPARPRSRPRGGRGTGSVVPACREISAARSAEGEGLVAGELVGPAGVAVAGQHRGGGGGVVGARPRPRSGRRRRRRASRRRRAAPGIAAGVVLGVPAVAQQRVAAMPEAASAASVPRCSRGEAERRGVGVQQAGVGDPARRPPPCRVDDGAVLRRRAGRPRCRRSAAAVDAGERRAEGLGPVVVGLAHRDAEVGGLGRGRGPARRCRGRHLSAAGLMTRRPSWPVAPVMAMVMGSSVALLTHAGTYA